MQWPSIWHQICLLVTTSCQSVVNKQQLHGFFLQAEGRGIKVSHKLLVNLVKYWLFCRLRKLWLPFVFHILNIFCDLKHSLLPFAVKEMKETHFSSTYLNALISSYCYKYVVIIFSQCPINQDPWPELDLCPVKKQSPPQVILLILQYLSSRGTESNQR